MVREVPNDGAFQEELARAAGSLLVVDFFATWCGPCRVIAPFVDELAQRHPAAIFVKVDVEKCQGTAASQGVRAMPTFKLYVGGQCVDTLQGADRAALDAKVHTWATRTAGSGGGGGGGGTGESPVAGQIDLAAFVDKARCECLNEADDNTLARFLAADAPLQSDCDAQLIINVAFMQPVKIHSLLIKSTTENGPKVVKLFINQPHTPTFDVVSRSEAVQTLNLTKANLGGQPIALKFVRFQAVASIQVFVESNMDDSDMTSIDELKFLGTPGAATNMNDFKRVAGKKGESHG